MGVMLKMIKRLVRSISFWLFIVVALLGGLGAIIPIPLQGEIIAALTILGVTIQGVEAVHTQEEIEQARHETTAKHTEALQHIEQARKAAESQIERARQETTSQIEQARQESADQHLQALREIEQARQQAAQEIKKAGDKARAEKLLLQAEKLATSLMEKDALVNEAVALWSEFRQQELRQLGIEMSAAVIGDEDYLKWKTMQAAMGSQAASVRKIPLEPEERAYFIEHAIHYLTETVLETANSDAQGLVYLACIYGYCQQYDDMMLVLERAHQVGPIRQVMKDEFRDRPMLFLFVRACSSDQAKIERLRETLDLPQPTEQYFCTYITQEYLQTSAYQRGDYSEWVGVRKSAAPGEGGSALIKIALVFPPEERKTYAFTHDSKGIEYIVPSDKQESVENLYSKLCDSFILFCPLDEPYQRAKKQAPKTVLRLGNQKWDG